MAQNKYIMPVQACCAVIDEWVATGKGYIWDETPATLKEKIAAQTTNGFIEYNNAVRILFAAGSSKLGGSHNRGIRWIKERWHLMKTKEGDSDV